MPYRVPQTMPDDQLHSRIESLRDDIANEDVEELLDILEAVHTESQDAHATVTAVDDRLTQVEAVTGVNADMDIADLMNPQFDYRDAAVLRAIRARNPEQLSAAEIQKLYVQQTDIREQVTLRSRIKELVERGPFENVEGTTWRFTAHRPDDVEDSAEA